MIVAAIAVVLDSGLPIFYYQERVGEGGKTFRIFKFRSMRADAEAKSGAVWASTNDPRKTRTGAFLRRFSIDELPQLFNVLRGDMSLVGPRPERPVFVDLFRTTLAGYDERHFVRPGITGWAQVHMKRNMDTSAAGEKLTLRPAIPPELVAVSRRRRSAFRHSASFSFIAQHERRASSAYSAVDERLRRRTADRRAASALALDRASTPRCSRSTNRRPASRPTLPFPIFHASRKGRKDRLFLFNLVREIRRYAPDIVHTHTHVGKYWGRTAAIMAGVRRIVHTEHNPCDFRRTPAERTADWLLDRATSRVVTFFRDQGQRLSELEHLPAEQAGRDSQRTRLCRSGQTTAAPPARRLGVTDSEFAIMLIGRMEYQKNHILALRAFSMLSRRIHPRAILLFAGAGENEVMLRGLATALKVDDRVRFLGYRNDVPALLPGADLVLMTSWFEGMPLALLEAMIAGVPIVTTPWLGAANMLGDGRYGFLSSDFEPLHVAAEIERAIARPNIRRSVAERARVSRSRAVPHGSHGRRLSRHVPAAL